jgi:hypothetical protein
MRMLCSNTPDVDLPGVAIIEQSAEFRAPLSEIAKFDGKSLGHGKYNGECAAGVQWALRENKVFIGLTSTWKQGRIVRGNKISPGTAIASFRDGKYQNDHAAIFVSQDANGITVYDQYNHPKKNWGMRVLPFDLPGQDYSNDGAFFYTITTNPMTTRLGVKN